MGDYTYTSPQVWSAMTEHSLAEAAGIASEDIAICINDLWDRPPLHHDQFREAVAIWAIYMQQAGRSPAAIRAALVEKGVSAMDISDALTIDGELHCRMLKDHALLDCSDCQWCNFPAWARTPHRVAHPRAPITFEDVTEVESVKQDGTEKRRFDPDGATDALLKGLHLAMEKGQQTIWQYGVDRWEPTGEEGIKTILYKVAKNMVTEYYLRETFSRVRNKLWASPATFNLDPYLMPLLGEKGVNLRTGEVRATGPDDHLTFAYNAAYDPTARPTAFLKFVAECQPDPLDQETIIDMFAATAIRKSFDTFILMIGEGSNGKGNLEDVMTALFTRERTSAVKLEEIKQSRFGARGLLDGDLWIVTEVNSARGATTAIKSISSGELHDIDVKFANQRQRGCPHVLPILDCNIAFSFGDDSHGLKRRLLKLDFRVLFGDGPGMLPIDRHLVEKLTTPEELSGIVNLIIARAPSLADSMVIRRSRGEEEMTEEYLRQQDGFPSFCDDCLTIDGDSRTTVKEIYDEYTNYCKLFNIPYKESKISIGMYIKNRYGITSQATHHPIQQGGRAYRYYQGLGMSRAMDVWAEIKLLRPARPCDDPHDLTSTISVECSEKPLSGYKLQHDYSIFHNPVVENKKDSSGVGVKNEKNASRVVARSLLAVLPPTPPIQVVQGRAGTMVRFMADWGEYKKDDVASLNDEQLSEIGDDDMYQKLLVEPKNEKNASQVVARSPIAVLSEDKTPSCSSIAISSIQEEFAKAKELREEKEDHFRRVAARLVEKEEKNDPIALEVKFLKAYRSQFAMGEPGKFVDLYFDEGDVCYLPSARARELVDRGIAELVEPEDINGM